MFVRDIDKIAPMIIGSKFKVIDRGSSLGWEVGEKATLVRVTDGMARFESSNNGNEYSMLSDIQLRLVELKQL